jgi:hypothetical protein
MPIRPFVQTIFSLKIVLTVSAMLCQIDTYAETEASGVWGIVSASGVIGENADTSRWRFWFDGQYRNSDLDTSVHQILLRPTVSYVLNSDVSLWLGYAYVETDRPSGSSVREHRLWQQLSWTARRFDRGVLSARFRLEERDIDLGDDLGWTLRAQLKYIHFLDDQRQWQAFAFIEPFVALNDTDWGAQSGMQQNRTALGIGYQLNDRVGIEMSYMNQYLVRRRSVDISNHLLVLSLKTNF